MTTPTSAAHADRRSSARRDAEVTVAVDGTDAGLRAVQWATREAAARRAPLAIVHAAPYAAGSTGSLRAHADRILGRAFTVAVRTDDTVRARTVLLDDDPRTALVEASRSAALLVLGIGAAGGPQGALVGSLALEVAGVVEAPLVVVRRGGRADGAVVAAVRDLASDASTLLQARHAALRHHAVLEIVHATRSAREGAETRDVIEDRMRHWEANGPSVRYSVHLVCDGVVKALAARSVDAQLLVVGPADRHHHVLGSIARAAIRAAGCPVLVAVPPREEPAPRTDPHDRAELW